MMRRIAVFLCLGLGLSGCAIAGDVTTGIGSGGQCRVLTDIAEQIHSDNYDPKVRGGADCTRDFAAAGLPMLGLRKPNEPDAPGLDHIIQFEAPEKIDATTVKVKLSFTCPRLCGHGEEVTAELKDGRWVITGRKQTWIS
jgi:hypothetical protein